MPGLRCVPALASAQQRCGGRPGKPAAAILLGLHALSAIHGQLGRSELSDLPCVHHPAGVAQARPASTGTAPLGGLTCSAPQVWRAFYSQRWNLTPSLLATPRGAWQAVYSRKLRQATDLYGRCSHDVLRGHQQSARCIALLPSHGLLASGTATELAHHHSWSRPAITLMHDHSCEPLLLRTLMACQAPCGPPSKAACMRCVLADAAHQGTDLWPVQARETAQSSCGTWILGCRGQGAARLWAPCAPLQWTRMSWCA